MVSGWARWISNNLNIKQSILRLDYEISTPDLHFPNGDRCTTPAGWDPSAVLSWVATVMAMVGTLGSSKHYLNSENSTSWDTNLSIRNLVLFHCNREPNSSKLFDKFAGTCNVNYVIFHYINDIWPTVPWFRTQARINARLQGPCSCCEAMPIPQVGTSGGRRGWEGGGWNVSFLFLGKRFLHMGVSLNGGTPKSSIWRWIFHYKSSILGYPLFLETSISSQGETRKMMATNPMITWHWISAKKKQHTCKCPQSYSLVPEIHFWFNAQKKWTNTGSLVKAGTP